MCKTDKLFRHDCPIACALCISCRGHPDYEAQLMLTKRRQKLRQKQAEQKRLAGLLDAHATLSRATCSTLHVAVGSCAEAEKLAHAFLTDAGLLEQGNISCIRGSLVLVPGDAAPLSQML